MPFGVLGGRGRTCPARLWMVYGRLWEGRGPGMPGPYRAAIFAAGGALNARRRGQDPSLQFLWESRCLLGYWAVGAGHARPGCGWCTGGYGKAAGRACPAPTGRLWGRRAVLGRPVKAPLAVCGCRSPSSFCRGFGCLRHGGFLRLRGVVPER